jgi:hypothetical protein
MNSRLPLFNEMLDALSKCGPDCAFAKLGAAVVIVGQGEPFSVWPSIYRAQDIDTMVKGGILKVVPASSVLGCDRYLPMTSHARGADA